MKALVFGSIGTLAETSDIQRRAFNDAFRAHGLDWHWDIAIYGALLRDTGGRDRIARFARQRGETVDADSIHAMKSDLFQTALTQGLPLRPGVAATLDLAQARGWKLALATGTSAENVAAILRATGLPRSRFDVITDAGLGLPPKPAPDVFTTVLARLGLAPDLDPDAALAIEDNPDGFAAARGAGLRCLAFPGRLHGGADFAGAIAVQTTLDLTDLDPDPS